MGERAEVYYNIICVHVMALQDSFLIHLNIKTKSFEGKNRNSSVK